MDLIYWLLLLKAPHLGVKTFYKALKFFETPQQVFIANHTERATSGIFRKPTLEFLQSVDKSLVINVA